MMNTVKYPNWDKVDPDAPDWLVRPDKPKDTPLKLHKGMVAYASVNGISIKMQITKIVTSSSADSSVEAELLEIDFPELRMGDTVFIKESDMKMCVADDGDNGPP